MQLSISKILVSVALAVTGCAVDAPSDPIDRDVACRAQADAWCPTVGFDSPGCRTWYLHECEPSGPTGTVDSDAQDSCLRDLAVMTKGPLGWGEPVSCQATWLDS